jgi:hypothetical protein
MIFRHWSDFISPGNRKGLREGTEQSSCGAAEGRMQFVLAVFLFVVVVGAVDARLPWPINGKRSTHP